MYREYWTKSIILWTNVEMMMAENNKLLNQMAEEQRSATLETQRLLMRAINAIERLHSDRGTDFRGRLVDHAYSDTAPTPPARDA